MIGQDIVSVIAQQVTEKLEEVEGAGILTESERKAADEFVLSKFYCGYEHHSSANYGVMHSDYYSIEGEPLFRCGGPENLFLDDDFRTPYWDKNENPEAYYFTMEFHFDKTTRRVKKESVITYMYLIRLVSVRLYIKQMRGLYLTTPEGNVVTDRWQNEVFETKVESNEMITREGAVKMFEEVLDAMRKTNKCYECKKYKQNTICVKDGVGICPECYMHARVKRARKN